MDIADSVVINHTQNVYFRRSVDRLISAWLQHPVKKPLLLMGPPSVGKATSCLHCAETAGYQVTVIDFRANEYTRNVTDDITTLDELFQNIRLMVPTFSPITGKTILLFKDIQYCPEIAGFFPELAKNKDCFVMATGSLTPELSKTVDQLSKGQKADLQMGPMDFEEFLWSKGYAEDIGDKLLEHMQNFAPFGKLELSVYRDLFKQYCVVGGMPKVVSAYLKTGDKEVIVSLQKAIADEWRTSFIGGIRQCMVYRYENVYDYVPSQLMKENKKFQLTVIEPGGRQKNYEAVMNRGDMMGILCRSSCLDYPGLPMTDYINEGKNRLYLADTGLLNALIPTETDEETTAKNEAVIENVMADTFSSQGYKLYYHKKECSTLETDFIIRNASLLIPVEIHDRGLKTKALRTMLDSKDYPDIKFAFRFCDDNIDYRNGICVFPYFCAFLLKRFLRGIKQS